jgi:hypothetical protein
MGVAYEGAKSDVADFYHHGRLPDNLPKLIVANIGQIPIKTLAQITTSITQSATGFFDTHPSDSERIAHVRQDGPAQSPRFVSRLPASALFFNFDQLCRNVTLDLYRELLGSEFKAASVHPVEQLLETQRRDFGAGEALERFFMGSPSLLRPVPVASGNLEAPANPQECLARLKKARAEMAGLKTDYAKTLEAYQDADAKVIQSGQAIALHAAGIIPQNDRFAVPCATQDQAQTARTRSQENMLHLAAKMRAFEQAAAERLSCALQLLCLPQVAKRVAAPGALQRETAEVFAALRAFTKNLPGLMSLRDKFEALAALFEQFENRPEDVRLIETIIVRTRETRSALAQLHDALDFTPYPFDHAEKGLTVARFLLGVIPPEEDVSNVFGATQELYSKAPLLYHRLASHAAAAAEQVETALGLAPLEAPAAQ